MKRVLNICPYRYLPHTSGGEKYISLFNEHLAKIADLYVAGVVENDNTLASGYQLHKILGSSRFRYINILLFFKLRKLILREKIQTVVLEHPYMGWLGILLKWFTGTKLIIHTHNVEYQRFRSIGKWWWWILKYYECMVLKYADSVFCISEEDRKIVHTELDINKNKLFIIPFGINQTQIPNDKEECKKSIAELYGFDSNATLLLFTGSLDYKPNADALNIILKEINPRLLTSGLPYNILVAGKGLSKELNQLKAYNDQHIWYAGFIKDIDTIVKGADISLNTVETGGGVKTKVIESIGLNTLVVSTKTGANGIDKKICGSMLVAVADADWDAFTEAVLKKSSQKKETTSDDFYAYYAWEQIEKTLLGLV